MANINRVVLNVTENKGLFIDYDKYVCKGLVFIVIDQNHQYIKENAKTFLQRFTKLYYNDKNCKSNFPFINC